MRQGLALIGKQQHDIAGLGLRLEQFQRQASAIDRLGVLAALQGGAGSAIAKAPLFAQRLVRLSFLLWRGATDGPVPLAAGSARPPDSKRKLLKKKRSGLERGLAFPDLLVLLVAVDRSKPALSWHDLLIQLALFRPGSRKIIEDIVKHAVPPVNLSRYDVL
jgi:hypothetical protein